MPILAKVGCNAGTCHGAEKGRNGFYLSLRGYDPDYDYLQLTNDLSGRRFNRVEPAQSLMLLKTTADVPHEGQQVIVPDGRRYHTLLSWIRQGAKFADDDASRVVMIDVSPKTVFIDRANQKHKVLVQAHYADGSMRDVTRDAIISSSDTEVATMEENQVTALRRGEAAVLVRYEGIYASAVINVMGDRSGWKWTDAPRRKVRRDIESDWVSDDIPIGFRIVSTKQEMLPDGEDALTHILYSDGLATVSVFVAAANDKHKSKRSRVGASNSYSTVIDGHRVTAVGEVPKMTVEQIATSMRQRQ